MNVAVKPRVFIGSSAEGHRLARALHASLTHEAQVTIWSHGIFQLNQTALQSLLNHLDATDFAVFIFSPDDRTYLRGAELTAARDNVIFELGLSIGKLGADRAFFVKPRGLADFRIPTDLFGITPGEYEIDRDDDNAMSAVSVFAYQLSEIINRLGRRQDSRDIMEKNKRLTAQVNFLYSLVKHSNHTAIKYNRVMENFLGSCSTPDGFSPSAATLFSLVEDELVQIGHARDVDEGKRYSLDHNERFPEDKSWVVESFLSNKSIMAFKEQNTVRGEYEYIICIPIAKTFVVTVHLLINRQVPEERYDALLEQFIEKENQAILSSLNTFLERGVEAYVEQQPAQIY